MNFATGGVMTRVTQSITRRSHGHSGGGYDDVGVAGAIAQAQSVAGDRSVVIASANVARQCLDEGLLDVINVSRAPVMLGRGIPFFGGLERYPVMLEDPVIVPGSRVTHMYFRVRR